MTKTVWENTAHEFSTAVDDTTEFCFGGQSGWTTFYNHIRGYIENRVGNWTEAAAIDTVYMSLYVYDIAKLFFFSPTLGHLVTRPFSRRRFSRMFWIFLGIFSRVYFFNDNFGGSNTNPPVLYIAHDFVYDDPPTLT